MTCDFEDNALAELLPLLTSGEDDRFRDALRLLLNAAMVLERQQHLRAAPYERAKERTGHANGFKEKAFQTRLGKLGLARSAGAGRQLLSAKSGKRAAFPNAL